jgi:hypothetical protein
MVSQVRAPNTHINNSLIDASYTGLLLIPVLVPHFCTSISWDHLSDKLLISDLFLLFSESQHTPEILNLQEFFWETNPLTFFSIMNFIS